MGACALQAATWRGQLSLHRDSRTIDIAQTLSKTDFSVQYFGHWSATTTPFHLERFLLSSKLMISVNLYLSPSHLQSVGAQLGGQLGGLGDERKVRIRTRFWIVRKAIPSIFSDFLELKPFLCRITVGANKINGCWKSAADDLWNGRCSLPFEWGLGALHFKARGSNYVVVKYSTNAWFSLCHGNRSNMRNCSATSVGGWGWGSDSGSISGPDEKGLSWGDGGPSRKKYHRLAKLQFRKERSSRTNMHGVWKL